MCNLGFSLEMSNHKIECRTNKVQILKHLTILYNAKLDLNLVTK